VFSLGLSLISVAGLISYFEFIDAGYVTLLPGISIACGAMIAVLAFNRDKEYQASENCRKTDEIYLSLARESFQEVVNLLKDRNNDRMIWVRAARLLLQTMELKKKIQTQDIIKAFELAEESTRIELYMILTIQPEGSGKREALPPQFYYGIEDWETEEVLDEAAIKGGSKSAGGQVTIDKNLPEPSSKLLSKHSVVAIYEFLKFPENYDDPLPKVEVWTEGWEESHGIDQGARRYVEHASKTWAIDGKLVKADNNNQIKKEAS
jgi:preprotein translocase subunit Sec61beta